MGSRGRGSLSPASTSRFLLLVPALLSGAGLAAAPFIWLGPNASLGGDDTRLYFVYPLQWLEHFALPSFGSLSGSAAYSPQMHFVPFTLLLAGVAQVLPQINLEAFSFGIALMSGFTGTYVTALLLMPSHLNYLHRIMAAALGGLVYVSAPLIATMYWTDPLSWVMAVGGAPALIAASVAYIKYGHLRWLLLFTVLTPFYAIGLAILPVSLPYAIGAGLVAGVALAISSQRATVLVRLLVLAAVTLAINLFWAIPLAVSLFLPGGFARVAISVSGETSKIIHAVAHGQSILFTLGLLPSEQFLKNFGWEAIKLFSWSPWRIALTLLFPALIVATLFVSRCVTSKRILIAVLPATVMLAYLQTINVTSTGVQVFSWFSSLLPGLDMFRNFYNKFTGAYVFFYSLTLALSLAVLLSRIRWRWAVPLVAIVIAILVVQGAPMLSGRPLFLSQLKAQDGQPAYGQVGQIPASYMQAMNFVASSGTWGRVLELPLSANYWSVFPMTVPNSVYVGSSPVRVLSGHDSFNSLETFGLKGVPGFQQRVKLAFDQHDYKALSGILRLTGIRFIVYTRAIPGPTVENLLNKPMFPASSSGMAQFARAVDASRVAAFSGPDGTTTEVYAVAPMETLPTVFVTTQARLTSKQGDLIAAMEAQLPRDSHSKTSKSTPEWSSVSEVEMPASASQMIVAGPPNAGGVTHVSHTVAWRYDIAVSARAPALLVLLEPYQADWTAQVVSPKGPTNLAKVRVDGYASGWILPTSGQYRIQLYYAPQRISWMASAISAVTLAAVALLVIGGSLRSRTRV